jgi:hypothetical protein
MLTSVHTYIACSFFTVVQIDPLLTPTGKKLQDGSRAVARQLTTDILPSLTSSNSRSRRSNNGFPLPPTPIPVEQVTKLGARLFSALSNQLQMGLQNLQEDLKDPIERIPARITQQTSDFVSEATSLFSGEYARLPEPPYRIVVTTPDYEIRDYDSYTAVCTNIMETTEDNDDDTYSPDTSLESTGMAFNSLFAYLRGANQKKQVLGMTTPVTITSTGEMRFFLSDDMTNQQPATAPPEPVSPLSATRLQEIPAARLAVRRFTGFVTAGEIARQKDALLTALYMDGNRDDTNNTFELDAAHGQTVGHLIFQYDAPYTLPVLRRNEIAVPILTFVEEDHQVSQY